jgi:hypothetical protein
MTTLRRGIAIPLALAMSLAIAPTLTGCFFNPQSVVEGVVKQATGGDVDLGGSSLPDDFPVDQVPVIDGEIVYGGSLGNDEGKVWNVTIMVGAATAIDDITTQLTGAGFEKQVGGDSTADGGTGVFESDAYGVVVVVAKDSDNGFIANYTVTSVNK